MCAKAKSSKKKTDNVKTMNIENFIDQFVQCRECLTKDIGVTVSVENKTVEIHCNNCNKSVVVDRVAPIHELIDAWNSANKFDCERVPTKNCGNCKYINNDSNVFICTACNERILDPIISICKEYVEKK